MPARIAGFGRQYDVAPVKLAEAAWTLLLSPFEPVAGARGKGRECRASERIDP